MLGCLLSTQMNLLKFIVHMVWFQFYPNVFIGTHTKTGEKRRDWGWGVRSGNCRGDEKMMPETNLLPHSV